MVLALYQTDRFDNICVLLVAIGACEANGASVGRCEG